MTYYTIHANGTMESIVQFAFPEVTCRFALRKRGRRKYGLLADLLDSGMGMASTVGMMDGTDMLHEDLRRSTTYSTHIDFDIEELNPDQVEDHLSKLLPDGSTLLWPFSGSYNVIEYGVGGFFSEHQDKKQKRNHCATLLIFPPAVGILAHTGGELILDRGRVRFDSSANREWTFIAFHTELAHECKPVLSGRRVVFKTELYSSKPVERPEYEPIVCDGSMRYMED